MTNEQVILKFDAEAQAVFNEWLDELEHRLISDDLQGVPAFTGHLSKYRSLMPALALIFHLIDFAAGLTTSTRISAAHAQRAAAWCEYLELHARKVYAAELNKPVATAELLLERIEAGQIMHGMAVRDVHRKQWAGLGNREVVGSGLATLQEHGYLRLVSIPTRGRATEVIALHPELRKVSDDE